MNCERCGQPYRVRDYLESGDTLYYCNTCNRQVWFGPEPESEQS